MAKYLVVVSLMILLVVLCTTPVHAKRICRKNGKACNTNLTFYKRLLDELRRNDDGETLNEKNIETGDNADELELKIRLLSELLKELDDGEEERATKEEDEKWQ